MNDQPIFLSNERVALREFAVGDWPAVHAYASQAMVCRYQPWGPNTKIDSQKYVLQAIRDAEQQPRRRYALAMVVNGNLIGAGEINIKDVQHQVGEIAYVVNPAYWGQGIATEVAQILLKFGFRELEIHRIQATCDCRNIGSAKVLEKSGMTKEGRLREHLWIKDNWRDSYLYSILEQERKARLKHG